MRLHLAAARASRSELCRSSNMLFAPLSAFPAAVGEAQRWAA